MKFVSYEINHEKCYGIHTEHGIVDLTRHLGHQYPFLKDLLAQPDFMNIVYSYNKKPDVKLESVTFLPVIPNPNKIICAGMNYSAKKSEFNENNIVPILFVRFPDSQTGHLSNIVKPKISDELDYEGELAIIIGKGGVHIPEDKVLDHIAGYSCYMDGSIRDWQYTWYTAGKNWPQTGAFGPYLVTGDEIPDPDNLSIHTYLNGVEMQSDNTKNLIFTIPKLISYISKFTSLSAGDVIITGSPGGVGKKRVPPIFMQPGGIIEVDISKIGRLTNTVVSE